MSTSQAIEQETVEAADKPKHQRKLVNAVWEPFLQFKLLMYMLGLTAIVAILLGAFLYVAFGNLIGSISTSASGTSYYEDEINMQLIYLFRYCGALFVLYVLLLAAVCVAYTHRLIGPFRPFTRHVEELANGNYGSRVTLRKGDVRMLNEYAEKLNELAVHLEAKDKHKDQ